MFLAWLLWHLFYGLWLLRVAHRERGFSTQLLCFLVWPYALYFGLVASENKKLKAGTVAYLVSIGMVVVAIAATA